MERREALKITAAAGVAAALGGSVVGEMLRRGELHRVSETRGRLGTLVTLRAVHPLEKEAGRLVQIGFAELERLEGVLSRHRAGTPMSRLNAQGYLTAPPTELVEVLDFARGVSIRTDGAFDPTMAPLLSLYRSAAGLGRQPTEAEIADALSRVGHERLDVRADEIRMQPGTLLTLDGVAKGYVVDRTVAALVAAGGERVLVDAGGDVGTGGSGAADRPWSVGVAHPRMAGESVATARLAGGAIATSGDYMQAFTEDRSSHHVIDPRTGRSPSAASSVSVAAPTAMEADALSTGVMVLGPEAGIELLEGMVGVEGMVVTKAGGTTATTGFGRTL